MKNSTRQQKSTVPGPRLIAVGDIHGCSGAFRTLIEAIDLRSDDTLVTLGDYIDRGPNSREVLELLIDLEQRCHLVPLFGNHEEMLLQAFGGRDDFRFWFNFGGDATLDSYGPGRRLELIPREHLLFVRRCRNFYQTDSHIFVHANYLPNRPLDETSSEILRWKPIEAETASPHFSGRTAIVGHRAQTSGKLLDLGFVKCIDTDCCNGGWLTAVDVLSGDLWQAREAGQSAPLPKRRP